MTHRQEDVVRARIGHRLPSRPTRLQHLWHDHGLSIVLIGLFLASLVGQTLSGWRVHNEEERQHGEEAVGLGQYLLTGHFGEAIFENTESEFLQMAFYVVLTTFLYQRGSSESKRPDVLELVDLDPRASPDKDSAPWPVRAGGWVLTLYENSLSLTFALLFLASFVMHAVTGAAEYTSEQAVHGGAAVTTLQYLGTAQFWFESFQNWQSEFLSLAAMVVFTIFLRQRGSPESKPVDAATWDTGD